MTPDAIGPLLAMQHVTTAEDAHNLAAAAVLAGATGVEAQQAVNEWAELQGAQVQQLFADRPTVRRCHCGRPVGRLSRCGCCCSIHDLEASIARHPAGKGPKRTDGGPSLREYLESKGKIQ